MIDQSKIIKRLELIKNLVLLEEENGIVTHISRIKEFELDQDLEIILTLLEDKSYSKAMIAIETYINKFNQLQYYTNPEIQGLKLEVKSLEAELNKLSNEKADIEKLIHEFGVKHNQELGELLNKILYHRKEKAKGTPQQKETEKEYNEYNDQYEIGKTESIIELSDEEKNELKQKYRKASKLCHPDVVNEDQKELADRLFAELNAAYEKNDLIKVSEILANLVTGNFFVNKSEAINEKQLLKVEIEKMRLRIKELKEQLETIKESQAYKTISNIESWDDYFSSTKEKLRAQLNEFEGDGN
ncbi:MAG TPA: DnaJ domain-containing protein [Puia sp.]|nr:DnaJ domain-containing protein [Puia sp.]